MTEHDRHHPIGMPTLALGAALALSAGLVPGLAAAQCAPAPAPVTALAFDSRYAEDSETRSEIDPAAAEAAEEALRPVEDFLRELASEASAAAEGQDSAAAACVITRMGDWAAADALAGLGSETAALTVGSRLAGFALILRQMAPLAATPDETGRVARWLDARIAEQIGFWELEAPDGAKQGNLRAWAALAAAARAAGPQTPDSPRLGFWAGASASFVLCTAAADGSLPQEMSRGPRALQYQLHAVTPLVLTAALMQEAGQPLAPVCDGALDRAVGFALADLADGGRASQAITGEAQNFFDGSDEIDSFHLAFVAAYLTLPDIAHRPAAEAAVAGFETLNYSKLGGNQSLMWGG